MDKSKGYLYLSIRGEFAPSDITETLQTKPTHSWKAGDEDAHKRIRTFSQWAMLHPVDTVHSLDKDIVVFLQQFEGKTNRFVELSKNHYISLTLVFQNRDGHSSGIALCLETMEKLVAYRMNFDYDLYYLFSHQRECISV